MCMNVQAKYNKRGEEHGVSTIKCDAAAAVKATCLVHWQLVPHFEYLICLSTFLFEMCLWYFFLAYNFL